MAVQLWTPGEDGIRASIWEPGGAIVEDGPSACNLAEDPETTGFNVDLQMLDNFLQTDGTLLAGTAPDQGVAGVWEDVPESSDSTLSILEGAIVNTGTGPSGAYAQILWDNWELASTRVVVRARVAAFALTDFNATIVGANDTHTYSLDFTQVDGEFLIGARWNSEGSAAIEPVSAGYCEWLDVVLYYDYFSGQIELFINSVSVGTAATGGYVIEGPCRVQVNITNTDASAFRVAAIELSGLAAA